MTRRADPPRLTWQPPTTRPEPTWRPDHAAIRAWMRAQMAARRAYHAEQHPEPTYDQRTAAAENSRTRRARKEKP